MNNIFKSNSRFDILSENNMTTTSIHPKNKGYPLLSKGIKEPIASVFKKDNQAYTLLEKAQENELKRRMLSIDNFPELFKNDIEKEDPSWKYIDTSCSVKKDNTQDPVIPYGWALLTRDKKTHRLNKKYNTQYLEDIQIQEQEEAEMRPFKILDALVHLHTKRTEQYIHNWGYEEYEQMFISPYYDPYYFDKLDAKEEEEEKQSEQSVIIS
jgi:hypothetical protein